MKEVRVNMGIKGKYDEKNMMEQKEAEKRDAQMWKGVELVWEKR